MRSIGKDLRDGDVILTNHPAAGGNECKRKEGTYLSDKLFRKSFTGFNRHHTGKIHPTDCFKDELIIFHQVFHEDNKDKPVFFVASRGHHADIGGLTPGSMPPNSTSLLQEGAQFVSFKIVEQGQFKEQGEDITKLTKNIVYVVVFSCYRGDRSTE